MGTENPQERVRQFPQLKDSEPHGVTDKGFKVVKTLDGQLWAPTAMFGHPGWIPYVPERDGELVQQKNIAE